MANIDTGLNATAAGAGFEPITNSLYIYSVVNNVLIAVFSLVGVYLMLLFIYGGYEWMSAGGDTKQVQSAKDRIRNATIGLLIMLSAFALSSFVLDRLIQATSANS